MEWIVFGCAVAAQLRMSIIGLSHRRRIDLGAVCKAGYNQHTKPQ